MYQSEERFGSAKRGLVLLGIAAIALLMFLAFKWFNESNHNPFDYARITEVDYKAVVVDEPGSNGKLVVTERLTFDIHAASKNNLFWELWRDLCEDEIDGVKVGYHVNSVKQILEDGSEIVYPESPQLYWEDYEYTRASQTLGPGKWFHSKGPYNENRRQYECVFFYVDGLYRETVVFEIEYTMYNAALRYEDCSELYITPYSESSINFLKSFKGQILIPNEIMPSAGNYFAHTYGTNAHEFPFTESSSANPGYHTFAFELNESQLQFKPYNEYIEFSLVSYGKDKHIFTNHASMNLYYHDNVLAELREDQAKYEALPETFRMIKIVMLALFATAVVLVAAFVFYALKRITKKHIFYEPARHWDYFREIPSELDPNFAAALVFCKHKPPKKAPNGYSAAMLSLVHKNYIELAKIRSDGNWGFHNVKIIVKYDPAKPQGAGLKPLAPTEEQFFRLILRHSKGLDLPLNSFQQRLSSDYEYTNSFVKNSQNTIVSIGVSQGYFQKADYKQPVKQVKKWFWPLGITGVLLITAGSLASYHTRLDLAFGAFFLLGAGLLACAIYCNKAAEKYVLLTQFGEDEYAKWRGLYNFLNNEKLLKDHAIIDWAVWEQYLIYATAFGIPKKVTEAINVQRPQVDMSPLFRNPYYRSTHYHVSSRSFRSATRTASARGRSGGYGAYGGYGGGGRGGGGGGGGH